LVNPVSFIGLDQAWLPSQFIVAETGTNRACYSDTAMSGIGTKRTHPIRRKKPALEDKADIPRNSSPDAHL
jgi:hypothetical protein